MTVSNVPPQTQPSPAPAWQRWARENLFSSPWNSFLTLVALVFVVWVVWNLTVWAFTQARWPVIPANFRILMVGSYPNEQMWRVWTTLVLVSLTAGVQWAAISRGLGLWRRDGVPAWPFVTVALIALFTAVTQAGWPSGLLVPLSVAALMVGFFVARAAGAISGSALNFVWAAVFLVALVILNWNFGSGGVETRAFGGLLLTLLLSIVGIVASFPLGVLLAVGRTSDYPIISAICTVFIEAVRGTPLVVVLFIAQLFVPLLLGGVNIDPVIRAMVGITIFSAAYLAENVRGGLQSVPGGQIEAARAVGLSGTQTLLLIVLPQALKAVLPVLTGQFIALLKDTSLVTIIGLKDLTGIAEAIRANPDWIGRSNELYFTISLIYFILSYAISMAARRLEKQLNTNR
jgi:general L-amino acid transport system permease protein